MHPFGQCWRTVGFSFVKRSNFCLSQSFDSSWRNQRKYGWSIHSKLAFPIEIKQILLTHPWASHGALANKRLALQRRALASSRNRATTNPVITPDIVHHTAIKIYFLEIIKYWFLRQYPCADVNTSWYYKLTYCKLKITSMHTVLRTKTTSATLNKYYTTLDSKLVLIYTKRTGMDIISQFLWLWPPCAIVPVAGTNVNVFILV